MRHGTRFGLALLLGSILAGPPAQAQSQITAEQAVALDGQVRDWARDLVGKLMDVAAIPLTITAAGERYRVEMGLGKIPGVTATSSGPTGGFLRPLSGGRWAIEDFLLPSQGEVVIDFGTTGMPAGKFSMAIGEQQSQFEFDPAFATPARGEVRLGRVVYVHDSGTGATTTRIARLLGESSVNPAGGGLVNVASSSTMDGYATEQPISAGMRLNYTVERIHSASRIDGVDWARSAEVVRTGIALFNEIQAAMKMVPPPSTPTADQRAMMRAMLGAIGAMFTRAESEQTWSGLKFTAGDYSGDLAQVKMGVVIGAPDGNAEFRLRVAAEGFASPMVPQGAMQSLVPRRIVLAPRISGVPKETLVGYVARFIDAAGSLEADPAGDAMQMLADHPVTIGIDELLIDLGVARLGGTGQIQVASIGEMVGVAELRMTGIDPLIRLLGTTPETRMGVPFLVMLKGAGVSEGSETVWRIAYANGQTTVNGTDLATLIPGKR